MRNFLILMFLATGAAQAEDCELPVGRNEALRGVIDFSDCIQTRVNELEAENTALRQNLDDLRKTLADFPGELVNINGRETRFGGERLALASYLLPSRSGEGAASLAIDDKVAGDLCALGCTLFLQATGEDARGIATVEPGAIGPCSFRYDAKSGAWSVSGCGQTASGIDGNGNPTGEGGGEVIASAGVCMLADAEPLRKIDDDQPANTGEALSRDRGMALYLIASPARSGAATGQFRCGLKLTR